MLVFHKILLKPYSNLGDQKVARSSEILKDASKSHKIFDLDFS